MSDPIRQIKALYAEAEALPDGRVKLELLQEAARLADTHGEVGLGFSLRKVIMSTALAAGAPDEMAAAFAWCVGTSDRFPMEVDPERILWEYRWVISELPHFPQVPRKQIEDTIGEMVTRYRQAGSTLRPVHLMRVFTYTKMGDLPAAEAALREFEAAERDWLSDSPRQELNLVVNHLCFAGRYQDAVDRSGNVMTGRVDDAGFFGQDSAELLLPLLELGRVADAVRVQRSGYRYLAKKDWALSHMALHVEFLARTDNFPAAVKVVDAHLPIAATTQQFVYRTHFLRSLLLLVGRLRRARVSRFKFRIPKGVPVPADHTGVDLVEYTKWLNAEVADYSDRFDARNGNRHFNDKLDAVPGLAARPAPEG